MAGTDSHQRTRSHYSCASLPRCTGDFNRATGTRPSLLSYSWLSASIAGETHGVSLPGVWRPKESFYDANLVIVFKPFPNPVPTPLPRVASADLQRERSRREWLRVRVTDIAPAVARGTPVSKEKIQADGYSMTIVQTGC